MLPSLAAAGTAAYNFAKNHWDDPLTTSRLKWQGLLAEVAGVKEVAKSYAGHGFRKLLQAGHKIQNGANMIKSKGKFWVNSKGNTVVKDGQKLYQLNGDEFVELDPVQVKGFIRLDNVINQKEKNNFKKRTKVPHYQDIEGNFYFINKNGKLIKYLDHVKGVLDEEQEMSGEWPELFNITNKDKKLARYLKSIQGNVKDIQSQTKKGFIKSWLGLKPTNEWATNKEQEMHELATKLGNFLGPKIISKEIIDSLILKAKSAGLTNKDINAFIKGEKITNPDLQIYEKIMDKPQRLNENELSFNQAMLAKEAIEQAKNDLYNYVPSLREDIGLRNSLAAGGAAAGAAQAALNNWNPGSIVALSSLAALIWMKAKNRFSPLRPDIASQIAWSAGRQNAEALKNELEKSSGNIFLGSSENLEKTLLKRANELEKQAKKREFKDDVQAYLEAKRLFPEVTKKFGHESPLSSLAARRNLDLEWHLDKKWGEKGEKLAENYSKSKLRKYNKPTEQELEESYDSLRLLDALEEEPLRVSNNIISSKNMSNDPPYIHRDDDNPKQYWVDGIEEKSFNEDFIPIDFFRKSRKNETPHGRAYQSYNRSKKPEKRAEWRDYLDQHWRGWRAFYEDDADGEPEPGQVLVQQESPYKENPITGERPLVGSKEKEVVLPSKVEEPGDRSLVPVINPKPKQLMPIPLPPLRMNGIRNPFMETIPRSIVTQAMNLPDLIHSNNVPTFVPNNMISKLTKPNSLLSKGASSIIKTFFPKASPVFEKIRKNIVPVVGKAIDAVKNSIEPSEPGPAQPPIEPKKPQAPLPLPPPPQKPASASLDDLPQIPVIREDIFRFNPSNSNPPPATTNIFDSVVPNSSFNDLPQLPSPPSKRAKTDAFSSVREMGSGGSPPNPPTNTSSFMSGDPDPNPNPNLFPRTRSNGGYPYGKQIKKMNGNTINVTLKMK